MRVRFNEISPHGSRYELREIEGLEDQQDFRLNGPASAVCTLTRKDGDKVALRGSLRARLVLTCDRCLGEYDFAVETEMQVLLETLSGEPWHLKELECGSGDLDTILLDEPVVDLDDLLRQQLYLSLPVKNLCTEECRGLCPECGANLNQADCTCGAGENRSPFAVLRQLQATRKKQ